MAAISDVARLANVSKSTVSRVLSGHVFVEEETRLRVENAMKELNYRPNLAARSLKHGKTKLIGLIIPDIINPYYPELVKSIEQVAESEGYSLILCEALGNADKEVSYLNTLTQLFVDGIIFISSTDSIDHVRPYLEKVPIIFVNRTFDVDAPCINIDNEKAGYDAMEYLIGHGHRRIGILMNDTDRQYNMERLKGAVKALDDNGIDGYEKYIVRNISSEKDVYDKTRDLLSQPDCPTALFVFNDNNVFGVYSAINSLGLGIPADISVIGFDDLPHARFMIPPLTTVRHPSSDNAGTIFYTLLEEKKNPGGNRALQLFEGKIVERESVSTRCK